MNSGRTGSGIRKIPNPRCPPLLKEQPPDRLRQRSGRSGNSPPSRGVAPPEAGPGGVRPGCCSSRGSWPASHPPVPVTAGPPPRGACKHTTPECPPFKGDRSRFAPVNDANSNQALGSGGFKTRRYTGRRYPLADVPAPGEAPTGGVASFQQPLPRRQPSQCITRSNQKLTISSSAPDIEMIIFRSALSGSRVSAHHSSKRQVRSWPSRTSW